MTRTMNSKMNKTMTAACAGAAFCCACAASNTVILSVLGAIIMASIILVSRKPLAGRVVQKRLLPMRKNKTPSVIVEMRSGNCKLQNKGRPLKNE